MTNNEAVLNLKNSINDLNSARRWLLRSYKKCSSIGIKKNYTEDEFDAFENLTSRYGRVIDVLINKVFRSIDIVELSDRGSVLDSVNRAEKRGIIDSADTIRIMKDLRNEIVHEYSAENLANVFKETLRNSEKLLDICEKTEKYCGNF